MEATPKLSIARMVLFVIVGAQNQILVGGVLSHANKFRRSLVGGSIKESKATTFGVKNLQIVEIGIGHQDSVVGQPNSSRRFIILKGPLVTSKRKKGFG